MPASPPSRMSHQSLSTPWRPQRCLHPTRTTFARARAREFNNRHIDISRAAHQYIIYSLTFNVGFLIHGVIVHL